MPFNPNWAAIAQILGSALASPDGNYAQGAAQGAQAYQGAQQQGLENKYREQQMQLAQQQADQQAAQFQTQQQADQAWQDALNQRATPQSARQIGNYGASVGGAPGVQTASGSGPLADIFAGLPPEKLAMLRWAGRDKGADLLADWMKPQDAQQPYSGLAKLKADLDAGRIDRATYDAAVKKETYIAPQSPQQEPATNLITLVAPDGKTTKSYDSRDPRVKQLAEQGWIERDRSLFPAPPQGYQPRADGQPGVEPLPGGPADPNRQTETQRNEFKKQTLALDNLESALSQYESALDTYGSVETYGAGKGVLENAYANVLIQAKEAANLGALTGPDMEIMNQMVVAPNSTGQLWSGGAAGVKTQIGSFRGQLKQKRGNLNNLYAPGGGAPQSNGVPPPPPGFVVQQ